MLTFVESTGFTAAWAAYAEPEELHSLMESLAEHPGRGARIPGCPLLRKLRFPSKALGRGTQGGLRVIYMHTPAANRIDLLTVYPKTMKDDLSPRDIQALCQRARAVRRTIKDQP
jgi:hypothetical protein